MMTWGTHMPGVGWVTPSGQISASLLMSDNKGHTWRGPKGSPAVSDAEIISYWARTRRASMPAEAIRVTARWARVPALYVHRLVWGPGWKRVVERMGHASV